MSRNNCSLYLHPASSSFSISNIERFIKTLNAIELIAQPIISQQVEKAEVGRNLFFVGKRYLDYIAYMGCSPTIQFEKTDGSSKFCHIKIHQFGQAKLITSKLQGRTPRCPHCKQLIKNWQQHLSDTDIQCDLCETRSNLEKFNWRKTGAYAKVFIEITDIFPKEAIPQQILLDKLTSTSNIDWKYFYSCQ